MVSVGTPSLDQLRVLIAVVDEGSFAAAGRRLNRATSAVSYTIAALEAQLGLTLFDRGNARRPALTQAGQTVLAKARSVASDIDDLKARVGGIRQGLEAELTLVVDVMLPSGRLVDAVRAFEANFPTVTLRLNMEALSAVSQLVARGMAVIGIGGMLHNAEAGLETVAIGAVQMIPVAAPDHPLAGPEAGVVRAARRHRQLVLTVRAAFQEGADINVFAPQTWPLADLGAKHTLLLAGIGWGYMPEPMVQHDLAAGRLVHLDLPEMRSGAYPLQAMYRTEAPPGPAGSWFIQRLVAQASASGDDVAALGATN